ncbi:diguanylate cyclase [Lacimicrobium alkaliphilum]|nr:diguanylate cyclase [Lacimicrobium alkaliphilum]
MTGSVEDKLKLLSQRFAERTGTELNEFRHKLNQLNSQQYNEEILRQLHQLLHRLTGSAGTFGLHEFSRQSRVLEQSVKEFTQYPDQQSNWAAICSQLKNQVLPQLERLHSLLKDSPAPASQSMVSAPADPTGNVLVLIEHSGAFFGALREELLHYGFTLVTLENAEQLDQSLSPTQQSVIIIAHETRATCCINAKTKLQQSVPHLSVTVICFGSHEDFSRRYTLAAKGVDGLFSESTTAPEIAEYLQRLESERLQASEGKVLIVDDDEDLLEHYRLTLSHTGIQVRTLSTPEEIFSVLSEFQPDILLLDVNMGDYHGPTLARLIRFQPEWLSLPIIYLSAEQDRTEQRKALAIGADEFLTKPISDIELRETVRIRCFRARQLSQLLARDSLTGLLKHSLIKQEVGNEHARCQRLSVPAVVVMLDLDHFKKVNDSYGHGTGDIVIKALANLLKQRLRKTDKIGRYGGEEFAVVMPECQLTQGEQILEEIRVHFSGLHFKAGSEEFNVTLSAGIALLNDYPSAEAALEAADQALYQRKQLGRNGISLAQTVDSKGNPS